MLFERLRVRTPLGLQALDWLLIVEPCVVSRPLYAPSATSGQARPRARYWKAEVQYAVSLVQNPTMAWLRRLAW